MKYDAHFHFLDANHTKRRRGNIDGFSGSQVLITLGLNVDLNIAAEKTKDVSKK